MEELLQIGKNIRTLRLSKGLSQEKLGEVAGLHRTFIGAIERGERNISIVTLHKIASALDTSVADLITRK